MCGTVSGTSIMLSGTSDVVYGSVTVLSCTGTIVCGAVLPGSYVESLSSVMEPLRDGHAHVG